MKIKTLIIEDNESVAIAIEHQLQQMRDFQVDRSINVAKALERISAAHTIPYDLILCDFNLGESTDGQQLLEFLRSEQRIPRKTVFIMITAEASYDMVASAVELAPDSYLLKPFTYDNLAQRISYAMSKREALKEVYANMDGEKPDLMAAIKLCNGLILAANRFTLDALKLKTECLIKLGKWGDAANVYDKIIAWRPTSWAEVGRARTLRHAGHPELAEKNLLTTIEKFPTFLAAYDEIASMAEETGDRLRAQEFLEKSYSIVPSNRRTRALGLIALKNGDLNKAARLMKIVTERDCYGLKRSTEDFFMLTAALRRLSRHDEAMAVLESLKDHFPETRPLQVRKMAAEAMVLVAANRPFDAKKRVNDALELRHGQMEPRTQLELGEACHECGDIETAQEIFLHVAENWQEDPTVFTQVKESLERTGLGQEGLALIKQSINGLISINNNAAKKVTEGRFDEVIDDMAQVAMRLHNHATVQANYVHALLLWLEHNAPRNLMELPRHSMPGKNIRLAREHLHLLIKINPNHSRLPHLQRMLASVMGESDAGEGVQNLHQEQEPASMESGG